MKTKVSVTLLFMKSKWMLPWYRQLDASFSALKPEVHTGS